MRDIYLVLVEEHLNDVDVLPYTTQATAVAVAEELVKKYAKHPGEIKRGLNRSMVEDGWIWRGRCTSSCHTIRVLRRELDSPPGRRPTT